jgi:hypothetical protein
MIVLPTTSSFVPAKAGAQSPQADSSPRAALDSRLRGDEREWVRPGLHVSTERLRCLLLWLTGASGAIVFIEPSPYELVSFATIAMFLIGGALHMPKSVMPFAVLLILINVGYNISASIVLDSEGVEMWLVTSWYLALTAIFYSAVLSTNTERRLDALMRGCVIGGVIASLAAIIGYARIFHSLDDLLLLYDRARGTFKDPNVLGAYLILPTLLCLHRVIAGNFRRALGGSVFLLLMVPALLLSFSRAAWGQIVYTAAIVLGLTFLTTRSSPQRLRIVILSITGVAAMTMFVGALLSIDAVAELFKQRASLHQDYDIGGLGRFARHILGALMALDRPLGIGPLQFSHYFPEDPHNSFLNAFMSGGWIAGICYPILVVITLVFGFRAVLVRTPWQQVTIVVFAAYVGTATESYIIDIDHWRHGFMIVGVMWGLIAATRTYAARERALATNGSQPFGGAGMTYQRI